MGSILVVSNGVRACDYFTWFDLILICMLIICI